MNSALLLDELTAAGIIVGVAVDDPEGLDLDAPTGVLTPEMVERVRRHKADLLALLRVRGGEPKTAPAIPPPSPKPVYTDNEQRLLGRAPEHVKAMVAEVKTAFVDMGGASLIALGTPPSGKHDLPNELSRGPRSSSTPIGR